MFGNKEVSDKELLKTVKRKLDRAGGSRITATAQRGRVTISGKIQYEAQRTPLIKAVTNIPGVRQVIDQLQTPPKVRPQYGNT